MMNGKETSACRPLVSVVVVTLNNGTMLRSCLTSLLCQNYQPLEIIVVDNGSTENIAHIVSSEFPSVRLVRLESNLGFAGGNNRGIREAKGSYVALINNDAIAEPTWISDMVDAAQSSDRIGAVACTVMDGNFPGLLDSAGVGIALDGMSRQCMHGSPAEQLPTQTTSALAFSGCACLLRIETLAETGCFDEDFFAYCEDADLSLRIQKAGWNIILAPKARVTHMYSKTYGPFSSRKVFLVERNHSWLAMKNFPIALLLISPFASLWRYFVQAFVVFHKGSELQGFVHQNGFLQIVATIIKAWFTALSGMPRMLRKRKWKTQAHHRTGWNMCRLIFTFRLTAYEVVTGETGKRSSREYQL